MNLSEQKKKISTDFILVAAGILLNLLGAQLPGLLKVPLFMDNVGTFFTTATAGMVPGMAVAYLANLFISFQQPEWLYWGLFGIIMVYFAARAQEKGKFSKLTDMWKLIPVFVLFTGVIGEVFSWLLNGFDLTQGDTGVIAMSLEKILPLPFPVLRIIACCLIEILDKLIVLTLSWILIRIVYHFIPTIRKYRTDEEVSPLRNRMVRLITFSGAVTGIVVFALACYTYYRYMGVEGMRGLEAFRRCITFGGGLFSAMLGAEILLVSFSIAYIDRTLVDPVHRMTNAMKEFIDEDTGKYTDAEVVTGLDIQTNDELKNLSDAMSVTATDIVAYIFELNQKMEEISTLQTNIISTMADIIESRDLTTGAHVKRTSAYAQIIAEQLRLNGKYTNLITDRYIEDLRIAAPLHDVGKICVSDTILNKPARLTDEEFAIMKTHTTAGREIVRKALENLGSMEYLTMAEELTAYHHEWWNGKGYPVGLAGKDIPLSARIMAVADVYDALTSVRPYKRAFTPEEAYEIVVVKEKGTHFDPDVVDAFVSGYDQVLDVMNEVGREV